MNLNNLNLELILGNDNIERIFDYFKIQGISEEYLNKLYNKNIKSYVLDKTQIYSLRSCAILRENNSYGFINIDIDTNYFSFVYISKEFNVITSIPLNDNEFYVFGRKDDDLNLTIFKDDEIRVVKVRIDTNINYLSIDSVFKTNLDKLYFFDLDNKQDLELILIKN